MALFRFLMDASYPLFNDVDIPEWKAVFHCWEESARGIFTTHCPESASPMPFIGSKPLWHAIDGACNPTPVLF